MGHWVLALMQGILEESYMGAQNSFVGDSW